MNIEHVCISDEDMPLWQALQDKTKAIHDMLRNNTFDRHAYLIENAKTRRANIQQDSPSPHQHTFSITEQESNQDKRKVVDNIPENIRGHFISAASIENKKKEQPVNRDGYPCCKKSEPCKHWEWDINNGDGYINSLTGEKKVVE